MQNPSGIKLCCLFLVILFTFTPLSSQAVEEITFTASQPLHYHQPRIIVPILTEAFRRNGIRFKAVPYPSLRSLLYSNTGASDGELHRVYDFHKVSGGKYPGLIRIESEMLTIWQAVFATQEIKFETWNDLKGYRVAYTRGRINMQKILHQFLQKKQIVVANSDTHAFKMLSDGLIDVVVSESRLGDSLLAGRSHFSNIIKITKVHPVRIYSYIHKKHHQLAEEIATSIEKMKQDGSYAKIVRAVNNSSRL
ncbi:MAG: transporter substrate-binding domain-containing protein [Pseudomonadales bacterium]|nr:transporter substrate-binding domain-containing protein [Pseudomonadales bacterium]NRA18241.1 transporter substrate-binding domain-containing protein [Oceanospirillaceae bacterium]